MNYLFALLTFLPLLVLGQTEGMTTVKSTHSTALTMSNLKEEVETRGLNIFTLVDHAKGASKAEMSLRPTQLILFGNPKMGTVLMQCDQAIGLDLPIRVLVYEGEDGTTRITYNDPAFLQKRYALGDCGEGVIKKMTGALKAITSAAAN